MIEPDKSESEIRHEPYSLPQGFHWDTINIGDPIQVTLKPHTHQKIYISCIIPVRHWRS